MTASLPDVLAKSSPEAKYAFRWIRSARPSQLTPEGTWNVWLILAGRGWGKTRTGAEDVARYGLAHPDSRIAIVAPTTADARDTCVEGVSGLLSCLPPSSVRTWNRSMGELTLANGTRYKLFSADEPDRLRGPQHHRAWCLVAGTPVRTPWGERPIETLRVGDVVDTSRGPRRITATGSREAELWQLTLVDGRTLTGSADHPIATPTGWKRLADIAATDTIRTWRDGGRPTLRVTSSVTRIGGSSISTAWSGKSTTGRSLIGTLTSTISTTIGRTTGSRTSRSWTPPSIDGSTDWNASTPARSAVSPSIPPSRTSGPTSARRVAGELPSDPASSSPAPVWSVARSSPPDLRDIAASGASTLERVGVVHNLTVEGANEFFANGILTHNCDELAAWKYPESWDQLMFGLRLGERPQTIVTTTPRPVKLVRELKGRPDVHVTVGSTFENSANLAPTALEELKRRYAGTRLGRQELNAEILDDVEGALWNLQLLEDCRVTDVPEMVRIVVAVDPAATANAESDETGIVVAGIGQDGRGYVLADRSCRESPDGWGRRAVGAYHEFEADRIIAEQNNGGDMVSHVLQTVDRNVPISLVHASRGKRTRAEPVAALYEQRRIGHIGAYPTLEDQLVSWTPDSGNSPDRLDALVWAFTELMLEGSGGTPQFLGAF